MFKKLLLFTGLFGALLGSCRQEDANRLADDATTPAGPGVELLLDFGADQLRETPTSPAEEQAQAQAGRAFDYVVYDETDGGTTKTAPHLDPSTVTGDVTATVILRSTDASQPVTITTVTMERRTAYPDGSAVPSDRLYLHTKKSGASITAKSGSNFTKGTWSMSLIVGGTLNGRTLSVDPNNLESVKYSSDAESDQGIDLFSANGNLKGITKATKGSSYTDAERAKLDVPYFSEWMTLEDGNYVEGNGTNPATLSFGSRRFALRPQGTLLRLEIKNENFSPIKLAGMRILTNMMTFRGSYNLSDANILSSKDLAAHWTGLRANGKAVIDSAAATYGWSLPFPNYTDFWLKDKEDIATGAKSSKYYLIWAMPQRVADTEQSRGGVMHVLLYDANRTDVEYNRVGSHGTMLPKALIRKPLLTRNFPEGAFRLSSTSRGGQSIRLVGAQTKIYTFLHYLKTADEAGYRSYAEMQNMTVAEGDALPDINYWASIFPGKLPDNPFTDNRFTYTHYLHSYDDNASVPKAFNTSMYGQVGGEETLENFPIVLSGKETYQKKAAGDLDVNKSGQAHNTAAIRIPAEMQIPYIVGDTKKPLQYKTDEANENLYFSTSYVRLGSAGHPMTGYMIVGWGEGQQFLTANAYQFDTRASKLHVYSRYLGPAFHRPYTGGFSYKWGWDMPWINWKEGSNKYMNYEPEADDAERELTLGGYQYNGHRQNNKGVTGSQNSLFYWIRSTEAEPQWLYYYGENIQNNRGPMGVGTAEKANGWKFNATEQGKLKAYIRLFSKKPIAN
jgi:lipoprotein